MKTFSSTCRARPAHPALLLFLLASSLLGALCAPRYLYAEEEPGAVEIMEMVSRVDQGRITEHIAALSSMSRCSGEPGKSEAVSYIVEQLQGHGLSPLVDSFEGSQGITFTNVVAGKAGARQPDRVLLIMAHLDSAPSRAFPPRCGSGPAPGANDDASGVAAVPESARVMAGYDFDYTVRYIFFDGEEFDHLGSKRFVEQLEASGETLEGAVNLDMIAYRPGSGNKLFAVHDGRPGRLLDALVSSVDRYRIPVELGSYALGTSWPAESDPNRLGDHLSFWRCGYEGVICISEDVSTNYGNDPAYHSAGDTLYLPDGRLRLRPEMAQAAAELSVAAIAGLAGTVDKQLWQPAKESLYQDWERSDRPVAAGLATRSWLWGPRPIDTRMEEYSGMSGGQRLVQYFDKGRMEDNPKAGAGGWQVTAGLLVEELVTGRLQVGDALFRPREPSVLPVAGDPVALNRSAPSYADFGRVVSIGRSRAPDRTGQVIGEALDGDGNVRVLSAPPATVRAAFYEAQLGHNVPAVFRSFMDQEGLVVEGGGYASGSLMDWVRLLGLPITEPYWIRTRVSGVETDVLVQLFERRSLTYTPSNPAGWQVEMGNVGRHYLGWRYGETSIGADSLLPRPSISLDRLMARGKLGSASAETTSSGLPDPWLLVSRSILR